MLWSLRKLMDDLARENLCNQQASDIKIALSKNTDSLCNYFFSLSSTKSFPKLQSKMVRISHDWLCMMIEWCWIILCSAGFFFLKTFSLNSLESFYLFSVYFMFCWSCKTKRVWISCRDGKKNSSCNVYLPYIFIHVYIFIILKLFFF